MQSSLFLSDCLQMAADAFNAGRMSRRTFLKGCAIAGVTPVLLEAGETQGAEKPAQIVHANWGGDAVTCTESLYGAAFTEATGVKIVVDGTGPLEGKIKEQVDAKNVTWDTCDADFFSVLRLGSQNKLEKIDYGIVDKNKILAPYSDEYGVLGYWYSFIIAWDSEKISTEPTWADVFDVEKIPGKRAFFKWMNGALEGALLADGVAPDKIYPLDVDRALAKIESIKDHLVFWDSGAASQQMFTSGEIVMGNIWQTRAGLLEKDTNGRVKWTWKLGNAAPGAWLIPLGNPAGTEWANRWIANMQDPKLQIEVMKCIGQGPANPAASDLMTPELRRLHPAAPENLEQQVLLDSAYFAKNYDDVLNAYLDAISA